MSAGTCSNVVAASRQLFPARYLFNREDFEHRLDYDRRELGSFATRVAFRECVLPLAEAGLVDFVDPHACIEQELDHDLNSRHCLDIARVIPVSGFGATAARP